MRLRTASLVAITSIVLGSFHIAAATIISQNFDSVTAGALPSGWTSVTTGAGEPFTTSVSGAFSGPNAATLNGAGATATSSLLSPIFAGSSSQLTLSFMQAWNFEDATNSYDGGVLEVSRNGGAFLDIATPGVGAFIVGGYTGALSSSYGNALAGRVAWVHQQSSFVNTTATINISPGDTIQLRWRAGFDSSVAVANPNWRIDDVIVTDDRSDTPEPASAALLLIGASAMLGLRRRTR